MQTIEVKLEQFDVPEWSGGCGPAVTFYVDGSPIIDYLARSCRELLGDGETPSPHGRWIGIVPGIVRRPFANFLGHPDAELVEKTGGRMPLAACSECGILNPLLNPTLLQRAGELIFDAKQYRQAFALLESV